MSNLLLPGLVVALSLSCAGGAPPFSGLDPTPELHGDDPALALLRARVAATNAHDFAAWAALHDPACLRTAPELNAPLRGRAAMREAIEHLVQAFPDYHVSLIRAVAAGPWVAAEFKAYGHMQYPLVTVDGAHIPATGLRFAQTWTGFFHVEGGRITEVHEQYDQTDLSDQLMGKRPPKPW